MSTFVPLSLIKENPVALRSVNRKDEKYLELVGSIKESGLLNPVSVREQVDLASGQTYYGLIDGLHRVTGARDAGLEEIPVHILDLDDAEVEEAQIMANLHRIETKPVEYTRQLYRILARNPMMTEAELAKRISKSPVWLKDRLSLDKLNPKIQELVDDNRVPLSNAYALARLPVEEQLDFLERAQVQQPAEFMPTVQERVRELRKAKLQGRDATPAEFVPQAFLQKLGEIKGEYDSGKTAAALISETGVTTAAEGFALAVAWVLHMDPVSQAAQRAKDAARKAKLEADKEARKKEREEKKAEEARNKTVEVMSN